VDYNYLIIGSDYLIIAFRSEEQIKGNEE